MDNVFSIINEAFKLSRQEATTEQAYQMVEELLRQDNLSTTYHLTFAWIAYRRLKARYRQIGSREARRGLAEYFRLQTERPSVLHSSFLYLAINIKKEYADFQFIKFLRMWGPENFREDDWVPFQAEQATIMSLAQKTIYQAMAELKNGASPEELVMMNQLLSQAVRRYPKTAEHQRQLGMVLVRQGLRDEAIQAYKQALLCERKAYFWNELAELTDDTKLRKGALCMALTAQRNDDFVGAIHLRLAEMLILEGDHAQALFDLGKVYTTYSQHGWKIPADYYRLMTLIPKEMTAAKRDYKWLERMAQPAADFLLDDLPQAVFLVERFFTSKKGQEMVALRDCKGKPVVMPKKKLKTREPLLPGSFVKARMKQTLPHQTELLSPTIATEEEVSLLFGKAVSITGKLLIKQNAAGKAFAFVKNCYVGAPLLDGLNNGQIVSVTAIEKDGKTTAIQKPEPTSATTA